METALDNVIEKVFSLEGDLGDIGEKLEAQNEKLDQLQVSLDEILEKLDNMSNPAMFNQDYL